jgi:hypothetical protein
MIRFFETRKDRCKLEIDQAEAAIGLAIGNITHFRVVVLDAVLAEFREKFFDALLIEMLNAASATGCDDLEPFGIGLQQPGHEGTCLPFEMTQNAHFIGKAFLSFGSAKRLMHPTVVADANSGPEGVLDLMHFARNMTRREAEASLDQAVRPKVRIGFADRAFNIILLARWHPSCFSVRHA